MGFITIFHHHLGNIFLNSFPTTEQANLELDFGSVPGGKIVCTGEVHLGRQNGRS